MASSITLNMKHTAVVTPAPALALSSGDNSFGQSALDLAITLNSGSTPSISESAEVIVTLTDGTATIDLTALVDTVRGALNLTGKKLRTLFLRAKSDNANVISLAPGESNGYPLNDSGDQISLKAGDQALLYMKDTGQAVDGTHKTLDVAGVGSQVLHLALSAG